jgi:hypothetical protein
MIRKLAISFLSAVALMLLPNISSAQATLTDDHTLSLGPKADQLVLDNRGAVASVFLKFDLSGVPAQSNVSKAILKLWVNGNNPANPNQYGTFQIEVRDIGNAWSEQNPFPQTNGTLIATPAVAIISQFTSVSIDITGLVQSWINGTRPNNGIGLGIRSGPRNGLLLDSKENGGTSQPPRLELVLDKITGITAADGLDGGGTTGNVAVGISNGGVSTTKLADGAITSPKIASGAVGTQQLAFGAVTSANIAPGAVGTPQLANSAVTSANISPGAVGNSQMADGAVNSAKISAGAVGTSQLANNAVNTNQIADGAVTAPKIGPVQIVKSLNNLKDDITLAAGSNITLTPSGNTLTIAATVPASSGWSLTGNAGTNPSMNFLGTTDNVAQEFRVNNQRAFRLEPNTSPNLIGGFSGNNVTPGAVGATIGGGGISNNPNRVTDNYGTVGGGHNNLAGDNVGTTDDRQFATVGGGVSNTASGQSSTVGGGFNNIAQFIYNTVSGGFSNRAIGEGSTIAGGMGNITNSRAGAVGGGEGNFSGGLAAVAGGQNNNAYGGWSTVPGGQSNIAGGEFSFAAGRSAQIDGAHSGVFLFSDSTGVAFSSARANEFAVRATGGFRFVTGIDGSGNPTSTWSLSSSGIRFPDGTTQVTAATGSVSITGVTAGSGLTGGGSSGNITIGIANGGVRAAELGSGAVNTTHIADSAVSSSKIASGQVVKGLNGLSDAVTLAAGPNITITPSGNNTLTIAADGGGSVVYTTGSYADPSWITSLSGSKITGSLTSISNIFSRTTSNDDVILGLNDGYGSGVHGFSTGGYGVAGYTNSNVSAGIYGRNPVGDAGRFDGNVIVSGKVGIGTASPGTTLEIMGTGTSLFRLRPNAGTEDNQFILGGADPLVNRSMIVATGSDGDAFGDLRFVTNLVNGPAVSAMTLRSSGNVGIGTTTPDATLEIKVGGTTLADAWTTRSSARFKTNIQPVTAALDKVLRLRGVSFNWKDTQRPSLGFIAEEVALVLPEAVEYEKTGKETTGLDYSKVTPVLVEAIKTQQQEIEELRRENARLQLLNAGHEARLSSLEDIVNAMILRTRVYPQR